MICGRLCAYQNLSLEVSLHASKLLSKEVERKLLPILALCLFASALQECNVGGYTSKVLLSGASTFDAELETGHDNYLHAAQRGSNPGFYLALERSFLVLLVRYHRLGGSKTTLERGNQLKISRYFCTRRTVF